MTALPRPVSWPLSIKVPVIVTVLMATIATAISYTVISRLERDQESQLRQIAVAFTDGIASAALPHVLRQDVWETYDNLERARDRYTGMRILFAVVSLPDGSVLASTDPMRFAVADPLPNEFGQILRGREPLAIDEGTGQAWVHQALEQGNRLIGHVLAEIDIRPLLAVRREVLTTLVLVNLGLTIALALLGYAVVRRMLKPITVLGRHLDQAAGGGISAIPDDQIAREDTEFGRLFRQFNDMVTAIQERRTLEARLADEERVSQLGRLASGVAHEVNNPLGGLMNAVDTLQKHGHDPDVRNTSLGLLQRGLSDVRNVVRAALVAYKQGANAADATPQDIDDLRFLVRHELLRRKLELDWRNGLACPVAVDGSAVRQIALNLILNACAASPLGSTVRFRALEKDGFLALEVRDQGPGLPEPLAEPLASPGMMALGAGGGGLGLWTVSHLLDRHHGSATVRYPAEGGTLILIHLPLGKETRDAVA